MVLSPFTWKTSDGLLEYPDAVASMEQRVDGIQQGKEGELGWLVEHPPLYTAGTSAHASDLLDNRGFPVYQTGRGGQYTYHGPGQRVIYLMLDLKRRHAPNTPDLRHYVQQLEQWIINVLAHFGVKGEVREGRVGIWVQQGNQEAKIAAIGIRIRRWVTYHGIALNVNPDLSHFSGIVPCGIREYGVTSLHALGINATMEEVDAVLKQECQKMFGL